MDAKNDMKNTLLSQLGVFVLKKCNRSMKKFIGDINGFCINNVYYSDCDSLYNQREYWNVLNKARLLGGVMIGLFSMDFF